MICIEDYSDSTQRGMSLFYEALSQKMRIKNLLYCSIWRLFIEADILQPIYENCYKTNMEEKELGLFL